MNRKKTDPNNRTKWWRFLPLLVLLTFAGSLAAQYCNSVLPTPGDDYFSNVTFAGINNNSFAALNDAPVDYTAQTANVDAGGSYNLSVTIWAPYGGDVAYAFFDWDQNGTLDDAGEVYTIGTGIGNGTFTIPIAVPGTALPGTTRMRVMVGFPYFETWPNPCVDDEYGEAEDYSVNVTVPACAAPLGAMVSGVTPTEGYFTWTDNGADSYDWELRDDGGNPGDAGALLSGNVLSGTPSIHLSPLTPNTTYTAYVRSDCGGGNLSPWASVTFTTPCAVATLPYATDFEALLMPPACWAADNSSGLLQAVYSAPGDGIANGPSSNPGDSACVRFLFYNVPSGSATLSSQEFDPVPANYRVRFDVAGAAYPNSIDSVYLESSADAGATWTVLQAMSNEDGVGVLSTVAATSSGFVPSGLNAWTTLDFPLPTGTNMIRFRPVTGYGNYVYIDNVVVEETPSCLPPTGLSVTNITNNEADLSWTASPSNPANGYQWEVRSSGSPGDPGPDDSGTTGAGVTTAHADGLNANSSFTLYVRSDCGGVFSSWAATTFKTLCDPATLPYASPFEEVAVPPSCWTVNDGVNLILAAYGPNSGSYGNGASGPSGLPSDTASMVFNFYSVSSGTASLISNMFTAAPANHRVRFDVASRAYPGAIDSVYLETSADGGATWIVLQAMSNEDGIGVLSTLTAQSGAYFPASVTDWNTLSYAIPAGTNRIRFRAVSDNGNRVFIDNVVVEETPSCLPPTGLTVTNITNNQADLSWTASPSNPANGYQWEVRSSGNPGDPGPDASGTTGAGVTTDLATGLTPNTSYTLYVRSDCGGVFSTWALWGFTTPCDAITSFPFTESFESASPSRSCWRVNDYVSGSSPWTYATGSNGGNITTAQSGTLNARFVSMSGTDNPITKLTSPVLDLSGMTAAQVRFWYGQQVWFGDQNTTRVYYRISPSDPWVEIANYTANVDAWTEVTLNLPNPSATYQIAFEGRNNWGYANVIDNVTVEQTPTCFAPTAEITSLAGGTATITWTNNASESYNWELRDDALPPGSGGEFASGNVAAGPVSIPGLTMGNTYTFYLQGVCDGGSDLSYWASTSVYMGYCPAGAYVAGTDLKIGRVTFADVDNSSTSLAGYEDFTGVIGNVQAGADYPISIMISHGYDADRIRVWIDYNQDLVFSNDELVATMANPPGNDGPSDYTVGTNFHMSAFALAGNTRMRVRLDNTINGPQNSPCGNSVYGQVEDYTLNVSPAPCAPPVATTTVTPDCANFAFSVDVDVTDLGDGASVTVSDNQGSPAQNGGLGTYSFGPYVNGTQVTYLITFGGDPLCDNYVSTTYACTPANQDCATAESLTVYPEGACVATNGSTINVDAESMAGSGCINPDISLPAVYYSFVATGFANTITTVGTPPGNFTTTVFDGCGGAELACAFGSSPVLVTGLTAGNTYIIRVAATLEANFTICVEESAVQPVPNDDCVNAEPVTISPYGACTPATGTLLGATSSGVPPSCINQLLLTNDVFYSFVANGDRQIITLNQDSINQPYFMGVYDGCGGTQLLCQLIGPGYTPIGTELTLSGLTAGNTYIVRVLCRPPAAGPFELCVMDPPPATQVQCGGPTVDESHCMVGAEDRQWAYHSNGTGDFTLTFHSGLIDDFTYHQLIVYDGPDANAPVLFQNESYPNDPTDLTGITVTATGQDLFMTLVTDNFYLYDPCFTWTVQCAYHPDLACDANPVECGNTYPGLTTGLGHNAPVDACAFNGTASTGGTEWFSYTAAEDAHVTFSTCSAAGFDTRISVFSGSDCNTLSCLAMNDDYPGCANGGSSVDINVTTGNTYWIMVTGAGAQEGSYAFTVTCGSSCTEPANDNCGSAQALANNLADGSNSPDTYTNACAVVDAPTTCSGAMPVQGVWFTFNSGNYDHTLLTLVDNGDDAQYGAGSLDYALYSGSCAGMGATGSVACVADASGLNVLNLTPNTDYTLLVYNTGSVGDAGSFGIMVEHPAHYDAAITDILNITPGQYCGSTMTPQVTLTNHGDLNLTAVEIVYGLSGGASHTYNWSGNLAYGQSVNVTLPTVPAEPGDNQTFTASVNLPNGQPDEITANDASSVEDLDVGGEGVRVVIHTDNDGAGTTWAIFTDDFGVYVQGGPYPGQDNTTIDEFHCLPITSGQLFRFAVMDANGDGLCCVNGNGYWELRKPDGGLLLRDLFDASVDGYSSPSGTPAYPGYGLGHSFYLPAGPVNIHPDECGIFNNRADNKVFAVKQAGTNYLGQTLNYQFEFSNPDAGYIRRIKKPRNYVLFSELNPSPLTAGVAYFARVRTDKTVAIPNAHWGTGCEMGLGATVNCTQLIEAPAYGHSCNETRRYGPSSFIYAQPVFGATQYEFRIFNLGEGYDETYVRNTYILELFGFANPLVDGYTYQVQVRAKVNDTWGSFCGTCTVSIDNQQQMNEHLVQVSGEATLWPNPVRDGQVNLNIEGITAADQHITVDVKDLYGQHVYGKEFENSGERFSTVLNLPGDIASGVYTVNITINGDVTTKRLTIVR